MVSKFEDKRKSLNYIASFIHNLLNNIENLADN